MWIEVAGVLFALGLYTLPAGGSGCCTDGFHTLEQLMSTTDTVPIRVMQLQGLHPALRITCDGNLMEIIYTTTLGVVTDNEYFDVWREKSPGTNNYEAVFPAISRGSETLFATIDENIALYSVRVSNFSVRARDFIGFVAFVPPTLRFLNLNNTAPGSIYIGNRFTIAIDLDIVAVANYDRSYFPLITAVIAPSSVQCSSTQFRPTLTSSLIPTTSPVIFTTAVTSHNTKTILAAVLTSGVGFCLILLFVTVMCVAYAVRNRKNKEDLTLRQSSGTEFLSPEVANNKDKKISSKEGGSSDGDNSSMESNPSYGDPFAVGHIQLHNITYDENKYHTLQFEHKPGSEEEQQHVINDDSNYYHTLQRLDHKPKYDSESEYCTLANTSDQCNAAGVPKLEGGSGGCDVTTLTEIENEYDYPNDGHNNAEHFGAIILTTNICYS